MSCKCYHVYENFLGMIGVCWGTKECEVCSCNGDEAKCDFYDYVRERAKKPITNADRIRAMTDEELAKLFDGMIINCEGDVPCNRYCSSYWGTEITCEDAWLLWLKEEAKQ